MTPEQLEDARRKLGVSQSDLAKLLGITDRAYRYYASGQREIPGPIRRLVLAYLEGYRPQDWD